MTPTPTDDALDALMAEVIGYAECFTGPRQCADSTGG